MTARQEALARASWRAVAHGLPRATLHAVRGHDLLLYGAGVTFYAAIAVVPGLLVAIRLLAALLGPGHVLSLAGSIADALPDALRAGAVVESLMSRAVDLPWVTVLLAAVPATVYGEGLRRAYLAIAGERDRFAGWRGRLSVLPVLVAAPVLLLAVLSVTPLLNQLFGTGPWGRVLGVYVALNVDWLVVALPLAWTFRVVAPGAMPWRACLVAGLAVGAFVAGFLQGFVLFLALPLDLGAPFGGLTAVGGVSACLLWLWLLHLVVLVGWVASRAAWHLRTGAVPTPGP